MPLLAPLLLAVAVGSDPVCSLDLAVGVPESDALAVQEVVCSEVLARHDGAHYRVRIVRLGGQLVLRLTNDRGADRQLIIASVEEVPVAAPRLVEAATSGQTVTETRGADNVVSGETGASKKMPSRVNAYLGMVAAGTLHGAPTGGAMFGLAAGDARWSFVGDLRLTGNAFLLPFTVFTLGLAGTKLNAPTSFGSIAGGIRHHLTGGENAPYLAMGVGVDYAGIKVADHTNDATGVGLWAEAGVDVLRSSTVGGAVMLRFDAPIFELEDAVSKRWAPFVTVTFAMRF